LTGAGTGRSLGESHLGKEDGTAAGNQRFRITKAGNPTQKRAGKKKEAKAKRRRKISSDNADHNKGNY